MSERTLNRFKKVLNCRAFKRSAAHLQSMQQGQHGSFLNAVQSVCSLPPDRVILEILESPFDNRDTLSQIVESFKGRGYRVTIDDFGARHSNFDRLWTLTPDMVKIDRELLLQADANRDCGWCVSGAA